MTGDWLRLHRKALDSRVFSDDWLWKLWSWCLMKACWKTSWKNGREVKPGQFVTGRHQAADQLKVSPSKWYRGMQTLQEWGQIRVESNNVFTVVTICNWETYQPTTEEEWTTSEQRMDNERTTDEQRADTLLRKKEGKEGKETHTRATFVKPSVEEVRAYCRERNNVVDPEAFVAHYESNGWRVGRNPMKDWRAAVRTWEKNVGAFTPGGKGPPPKPDRETREERLARLAREREESKSRADPRAIQEALGIVLHRNTNGNGQHPDPDDEPEIPF